MAERQMAILIQQLGKLGRASGRVCWGIAMYMMWMLGRISEGPSQARDIRICGFCCMN